MKNHAIPSTRMFIPFLVFCLQQWWKILQSWKLGFKQAYACLQNYIFNIDLLEQIFTNKKEKNDLF